MLRTTIAHVARPSTRLALPVVQQIRLFGSEKAGLHTTRKDHELDVQSAASKQGMRERAAAGNNEGHQRKDPKEGHPKAPEPVIGMQDERGHKSELMDTLSG
jgi:hypothetical protein